MTNNQNLRENLIRRLTDVAVYTELATQKGISNTAKSAYLRASIMLTITVVEGLVLYLIRRHTKSLDPVISSFKEKRVVHSVDQKYLTEPLTLCREVSKEITLMSNRCKFQHMNEYCLSEKIINKTQYRQLESVRKRRAGFHVFTLDGKDRGYTKSQLEATEKAMDFVLAKIALATP